MKCWGKRHRISAEGCKPNIIGGIDNATGQRKGLEALLDARSVAKIHPRILIAPDFSHEMAVATEMVSIANNLKAVVVADGPNTTDEAAISYRENFGSNRISPYKMWASPYMLGDNTYVTKK